MSHLLFRLGIPVMVPVVHRSNKMSGKMDCRI